MIKEAFQKWLKIESTTKGLSEAGATIAFFGGSNTFNVEAAIKSYSKNPWVNSAVSLRAESFANVVFYLEDDKTKKRIDESPILDLLRKPNKYITRFNMMRLVSMHEDLVGDAYWKYDFKVKGNPESGITRIQPLFPQYMTEIVISKKNFIEAYKYNLNGKIHTFPANEVTHFMNPSPESLLDGVAPIQAASYAVDTEEQSNKWNYNFFKNGASVGAILESDNTLTPDVRKRLKKAFDALHQGSDKAFKTIVLDGGLKLKEPKISQKDMEFSLLQTNNRDKVIAVYRTPKELLGQSDTGSLGEGTKKAAENIFAKWTTTPRIQSFVETLNLDYMPLWGDEAEGKTLKFDSIVEEDKDFVLKKDDAALNKWMTINERRAKEGLEPALEGGDELYQAVNQVPLNFSAEITESKTEDTKTVVPVNHKLAKVKRFLKKYPEEFKAKFEQKFLINHALLELKFIKKLKRVFAIQKKEVLIALQANKNYAKTKSLADDVFDVKEQVDKFIGIFTPLFHDIVVSQGNQVNEFFALGVVDIEETIKEKINEVVKNQVLKFAKEVNETTKRLIRKQLAEGLGAGEGVDDLAKRMSGIFKEASTVRTQTIARTETTKASSNGSLLTFEESDVTNGKEWLTTLDDRTRTSPFDHVAANGEVKKLDEDFVKTGEPLPAPGVDGSAGNTINCRCAVLPVII